MPVAMILALRPLFSATIAASLVLSSAGLVHAQTAEERAGARAAAEAGADAFDAGRYEEAIELFRRAEAVVHATPHLLYIARAQTKLGRLVEARESYLAIINEAVPSRANPGLVQTRKEAEQELDQLEPRIPQITVVVQGGKTDGLQVFMDEREVPSALVGIPRPVNPGTHEFYATAVGSESSRNTVTIKEGGQETVILTLRPSQAAAAPAAGESAPAQATAGTPDSGPSGRQIIAYSSLGVGAIGVGVGALFFAQANGLSNDADRTFAACNPGCTEAQRKDIRVLDEDAGSARTLSFVGFGVGVVGIATGVTLLLIGDSSSKATSAELKPGVQPWVGLGSAGLSGRF